MPLDNNCPDCNSNTNSTYGTFYTTNCNRPKNCVETDATCVIYTGPILSFIGINPDTNLENILIKLDEKFADISPESISLYDISCLNNGNPYNNMKEFVEGFSSEFCGLKADYEDFVFTTNNNLVALNTSVGNILNPSLTSCPELGITMSDNHFSIQEKQNIAICTLLSYTDISNVNWGSISPVPQNHSQAIQLLFNMIGTGTGSPTVLPTINNLGSCLVGATGMQDSVVDTVIAIRDGYCSLKQSLALPLFQNSCLPTPTTVQQFYSFTYTNIVALSKKQVTFDSSHFTVTPKANLCEGVDVQINNLLLGKVKVNSTDTLDYLENKLQAGTNISITTTGNSLTISSIAPPSTVDNKVGVTTNDTTPGFLQDKLSLLGTNHISWNSSIGNAGANEVLHKEPVVDLFNLMFDSLNLINTNVTLKTIFCNIVNDCIDVPGSDPVMRSALPIY